MVYDYSGAVSDVRVFCICEYAEYKERFGPLCDYREWLADSFDRSKTVAIITTRGNVPSFGIQASDESVAVRPLITLHTSSLEVGDQVNIAGVTWSVIFKEKHHAEALCDQIVAKRRFHKNYTIWERSELKGWLSDWFEYLIEGLDDVHYIPEDDSLPF